jgi:hypothetical protein
MTHRVEDIHEVHTIRWNPRKVTNLANLFCRFGRGLLLLSKAPAERLDLSGLKLVEILFAHVNPSDPVSHCIRLDILLLFAQSTLDILLCNLWLFESHLHHLVICLLDSTDGKVDRGPHFGKVYTGDFGSGSEEGDCVHSEMNFGEGCLCVWRDGTGGDGDDVLEGGQGDLVEWVTVVEIE